MATMNTGLGGPAGYGENVFSTSPLAAGNTDDGSVAIDTTSVFGPSGINFYGTNYTTIYLNSNGTISFGSAFTSYSTPDLTTATTPLLAPFWADVNLNAGGEIYWDIDPTAGTITMTWDGVAPYSGTGANSFQVVLTDTGGGNFSVEYIYEDIQWSSGDGGSDQADIGWTDGGANDVVLDGSANSTELLNYETNDFGGGHPAGTYSQNFSGGVPANADGTVTGTAGADVIDGSFTDTDGDSVTSGDDTILAGDGNDTVLGLGGDDSIDGGSGNDTLIGDQDPVNDGMDTISGGTGDDVIYGDSAAGTAETTTFSWASQGVADEANVAGGLTGQTANGDIEVSLTVTQEANFTSTTMETTDPLYNYNGLSDSSSIEVFGGATGTSSDAATVLLDFASTTAGISDDVQDVTFGIFDIDELDGQFIDQVIIRAYNADGEQVPVTITVGSGTTLTSSTDANGTATATAIVNSGGAGATDSVTGFIQVTIPGPVSSIEIDYNNVDAANGDHAIRIGDLQMTTIAEEPLDGNSDSLMGGDGIDTIYGQGGDDTIAGDEQSDSLYGGLGNDTIDGGTGNDYIEGGDGLDTIYGGLGDDTAYGGDANDSLFGFDGADTLFGGAGDDYVDGDEGADSLSGDAGADTLVGDGGNDSIFGGTGADSIYAGADDDTVSGGADNDTVFLDTGNDTFGVAGDEAGNDTIYGGAGNDTVIAGDGDDVIYGGDDNDSLVGNAGSDSLFGGAGDDYLSSGDNGNLDPGSGDTTGVETGYLDGGTGDDTLMGSVATDTLIGGDGSDYIDGANSDDQLFGGAGDTLIGGQGADTITVNATELDSLGLTTSTITVDGGSTGTDNDTLDLTSYAAYRNLSETTDADANSTSGSVEVLDGSGNWVLVNFAEIENLLLPSDGIVEGTSSGDIINGSYAGDPDGDMVDNGDAILPGETGDDDIIYGYEGNDVILAGGGDDEAYGGIGNDTLVGDTGNDALYGDGGDDSLFGGTGSDTLFGGSENDLLTGLAGADTMYGGTGDDEIRYAGGDVAEGGDGDDTFVADTVNFDGTVNTITGGEGGETFGDTLTTGPYAGDSTLDLSAGDPADGESGTLTMGADSVEFTEIEGVILGDGNDSVIGSSGDDAFLTGAGSDTVNAGAGNDTYSLGDDGSGGTDGNADTVILQDGFGNDTIVDFDTPTDNGDGTFTGIDTFDVTALTDGTDPVNVNDVTVTDDGSGNAILTFPNGESVTLIGIDPTTADNPFWLNAVGIPLSDGTVEGSGGADLIDGTYSGDPDGDMVDSGDAILPGDTGDDDLIYAYGGNDTVVAGGGNDEVYGGDGADSIDGGAGGDTIDGGTGNDTVHGGADNDTVIGDAGADFLHGDDGDDVLYGDDSAGTLDIPDATDPDPLNNTDTLYGGAGADTIYGGDDRDLLYGGTGDDLLDGGIDDDYLAGGTGADTMYGGQGDDHFTFSEGDSAYGGTGDDLFTLADLGEPSNGTITIDGGSEDGADTLQLGDLAILTQDVIDSFVDDGTGSYSGSITLDDGTILNFTEIENIICFTPGTRIATPRGTVPVEQLQVGDLVVTRDHGLQPIRWIESRTVPAQGKFAPIRIRPNAHFGAEGDLLVSPQHRLLFQGYRAELLFGESEVLVAAHHLVDGQDVTQEEGDAVTYVHFLLDQHEVVYAEGVPTESFHPGSLGIDAVGDAAREELFALFPELRSDLSQYGQTARRCLKKHEAQLIRP